MEIHEIWRVARRQWPIVVGCTALALLLFASWSLIRPTAYEAHERLIVTTSGSLGTAVDAQSGEEVAILRVSGYQRMITGPAFLTRVAEKLKNRYTTEELQEKLSARAQARIPVLDLTVTDTDPDSAVDLVKVVAETFASYATEIENPNNDGSLTSVAVAGDGPDVAEKGNLPQNLTVAAILGFLLGMAIATVRERTRRVVSGLDDLPVGLDGYRGRVEVGPVGAEVYGALLPVAAELLTGADRPGVVLVSAVDDALTDQQVVSVATGLAAAITSCGGDAVAFRATAATSGVGDEASAILPVTAAFSRHAAVGNGTATDPTDGGDPLWVAQREIDRALLTYAPGDLRSRLSMISSMAVIAGGAIPTSAATAGLGPAADLVLLLVTDGVSARSAVAEAHAIAVSRGIGVHGYLLCELPDVKGQPSGTVKDQPSGTLASAFPGAPPSANRSESESSNDARSTDVR